MNITPQLVFGLEEILKKVKEGYIAQFGYTQITYVGKKPKGTFLNTSGATEYEEFIIRRDILE
jgi:hypothetical protein